MAESEVASTLSSSRISWVVSLKNEQQSPFLKKEKMIKTYFESVNLEEIRKWAKKAEAQGANPMQKQDFPVADQL